MHMLLVVLLISFHFGPNSCCKVLGKKYADLTEEEKEICRAKAREYYRKKMGHTALEMHQTPGSCLNTMG